MNKRKLSAMIISFVLVIAMTLSCAPALAEDISASSEDDIPLLTENEKPSIVTFFPDGWMGEPVLTETDGPVDYAVLYEQLMSAETLDKFFLILEGLQEDDIPEFENWLEENGMLGDLEDRFGSLAENAEPPKTVSFTAAGPFMPAVSVTEVAPKKTMKLMSKSAAAPMMLADSAPNRISTPGLETSKTAKVNSDGTYTITLESYTTGKVTTQTTTTPVDIVLVLDQSGSMADSFGSTTRQAAMKSAVKYFIASVNDKYSADADHRMAIVTYGSSASTRQGWTYVNNSGKSTLQNSINNLPSSPSGATRADLGMQAAETLMGSGYSYTGSNTNRQKVVILFTDGVPTTSSDFDTGVATDAINSAKRLKDSSVTVYSVGIFEGADPNQTYGPEYHYWFEVNTCNGNVGDYFDALAVLFFGDVAQADVPAGNRFLNYLSSNFRNATSIGLTRSGIDFIVHYTRYTIKENFSRTANGYYLTASDQTSLENIFQSISQQISTQDITLGTDTVVSDIIADSFELPAGASVKVYTAAANAGAHDSPGSPGSWQARQTSSLTPTLSSDKRTITVSGFDYNANFVSAEARDGFYGKKLIVEFTVKPRDGFLGGNDVPTNAAGSAVYKDNKDLADFDVPTVNVPMKDITVAAAEKNVYLLADLTAEQLKSGATVTVGKTASSPGIQLDLSKAGDTAAPYGLSSWQIEYLNIGVEVKAIKNGTETVITDTSILEQLTDDTTYTVKVTMTPKTDGENSSGTVQTAKSGTSPAANINVFKPELTFKDLDVWYGDVAPENLGSLGFVGPAKWMHQKTDSATGTVVTTYAGDEGVQMTGTVPTLNMELTADSNKISSDGKINSKQDISVNAAITVGPEESAKNITGNTVFKHQACNPECGWTAPAAAGNPAFLLHPKTCQLTVTKAGGAADETYVFVVKKGNNPYTEVTIQGNRSVTVFELPVGNYKLEEVIGYGWSWRYGAPGWRWIYDRTQEGGTGSEITLNSQFNAGTITCTNSKTNNQWLNGYSAVAENVQTVSSGN